MILAFTGAGISKDSGINTFMEMPEVRDRLYRTFATAHPQAYQETIRDLVNAVKMRNLMMHIVRLLNTKFQSSR